MTISKKLFLGVFLTLMSFVVMAGTPVAAPQSIPTTSQAGLIGLAFIVGIIGARLISRMKASSVLHRN